MNAFTRIVYTGIILFFSVVGGLCQASSSSAAADSLPIGPGDLIQVSIVGEGDLQQAVRVNDAGQVVVNLLGPVQLGGLTPFQAAAALRKRYIDGGFLNNPQVSILIQQSFHQTVSVLGEVAHPGAVELTAPRSLLDVIALAGGFDAVADRNVTIRRNSSPTAVETVFLPNDGNRTVAEGARLIYPGDAIVVPKAAIVYVLGDVARPGGFVMENDSHITLLQAISLAGGPTHTAAEGRARLLRRTSSGYTDQKLALSDYEKGKLPDFELRKDDVLWVPFSYGKNIAIGAGSILGGTGSAVINRTP